MQADYFESSGKIHHTDHQRRHVLQLAMREKPNTLRIIALLFCRLPFPGQEKNPLSNDPPRDLCLFYLHSNIFTYSRSSII